MCLLGRVRRRGKEQGGGGGENDISLDSCMLPAWLTLRGLKLHRLRSRLYECLHFLWLSLIFFFGPGGRCLDKYSKTEIVSYIFGTSFDTTSFSTKLLATPVHSDARVTCAPWQTGLGQRRWNAECIWRSSLKRPICPALRERKSSRSRRHSNLTCQ